MNSSEKVFREFWEEYNRRPYNFYGFVGVDKRGRYIKLYTNKITAWGFISQEYNTIGVVIDLPRDVHRIINERQYGEFGLRQLPERLMERAVSEINQFGTLTEKTEREVMLCVPIPEQEVKKPEQALTGPWQSSPTSLVPPEPLVMLEEPLERAYSSQLRKNYPQYG